jgi:hypothetical protein
VEPAELDARVIPSPNPWALREEKDDVKGRGVVAGVAIPRGAVVLKFEGPIFTRDTCPDFSEGACAAARRGRAAFARVGCGAAHPAPLASSKCVLTPRPPLAPSPRCFAAAAIQVGVNAWMWSSGGLDDLVNHSCAPNLGLFPMVGADGGDGDLYLVARREIAAGEELSFDYSTSMVDEPWAMDCACVFCGSMAGAARAVLAQSSGARAGWLAERVAARHRPTSPAPAPLPAPRPHAGAARASAAAKSPTSSTARPTCRTVTRAPASCPSTRRWRTSRAARARARA